MSGAGRTRVWHVGWPRDSVDLAHGLQVCDASKGGKRVKKRFRVQWHILHLPPPSPPPLTWREASVAAEDFVLDNGRHRKAVEAVCKRLPQLDAVATLALVVKAVDAVDAGALVVAAQEVKGVWVPDFVREQQADCLQRLLLKKRIERKLGVGRAWQRRNEQTTLVWWRCKMGGGSSTSNRTPACHGRRSLQGKGSRCCRASHCSRTVAAGHSTVRARRLEGLGMGLEWESGT
jgi:hypothetical protein